MLPSELEIGMKIRYYPENRRRYRILRPPHGFPLKPEDYSAPAVVEERVGHYWEGAVRSVCHGSTSPYLVHTSVHWSRPDGSWAGNFLLHPEKTCEEQGLETVMADLAKIGPVAT